VSLGEPSSNPETALSSHGSRENRARLHSEGRIEPGRTMSSSQARSQPKAPEREKNSARTGKSGKVDLGYAVDRSRRQVSLERR